MTDNSQLNTPGEILAAARRKAGLSLEELAVRTKIQRDMLQAIERDEYHKISGDLYVKSFMGSFAREVGVDPELVVSMYRDFSGGALDGMAGTTANQWEEGTVEISSVGLPWVKLVVIAAIVACLGGAVYFFVLRGAGQETDGSLNAKQEEIPVAEDTIPVVSSVVADTVLIPAVISEGEPVVEVPISEVKNDTLSLGWQNSIPVVKKIVKPVKAEESQTVSAYTTAEDSASRILSTLGRGHLPPAFPGDEHVKFKGKRQWKVILRLICENPIDLKIKRDAETEFSTISWPSEGENGEPLPAKNLIAGQSYAVRRGFAVFWGAGDHFSLILPDNEGFEISVNGVVRDLSKIKAGQEIILDAPIIGTGR